MVVVPLLERQTRIPVAMRSARVFANGIMPAEKLQLRPLKNPDAVMFQPTYVPSGASKSTIGTPPSSLPSASTRGAFIGNTRRMAGGMREGIPDPSTRSNPGPQS